MKEKRIIKSELYGTAPFNTFVLCITALVNIVLFIVFFMENKSHDYNYNADWVIKKYGEGANVITFTIHDMLYVFPISIVIAFTLIILFEILYKKIQLVVTDKRVYGRVFWGKQVDLPIDAISAVGTSIFKSITIATSSGRISFLAIANRDEIYKEINKLLINRQKENRDEPVINSTNSSRDNIEELKGLKELLDQDIITPEEFEVKKKQLLGL